MTKPCRQCGRVLPLVDFPRHPTMADGHLHHCADCRRVYRQEYYQKNRDRVKGKSAKRYEENRDDIRAATRDRYAKDKRYRAKVLAGNKESRERHPEAAAQRAKAYYAAHKRELKARVAAWQRAHPDLLAEYQRKQRSRKLGVVVTLTQEEWAEICEASDNRCAYCGSDERLGMDHLLPTKRGGAHDKENVVLCCNACNASKGQMTPVEWIQAGGKWRAKANRGRKG